MKFHEIPGQEAAKKLLLNDYGSRKITHSYLFFGPQGSGKAQMAMAFSQLLACDDPRGNEPCGVCGSCVKISNLIYSDLMLIYPDSKEMDLKRIIELRVDKPFENIPLGLNAKIKIGQVKGMIKQINLGNSEGEYKIIHIINGERMTQEAANSLLKSLEEPPPGVVFIITCEKIENMLSTIVSRCRKVPFYPLKEKEFIKYFERKQALIPFDEKLFYFLARGSVGKAYDLTRQNLEFTEKQAKRIILTLKQSGFCDCHELTNDFVKFSDNVKEIVIDILVYWFKLYLEDSSLLSEEIKNALDKSLIGGDKDKVFQALEFLDKMRFFIKRNFNLSLLFNEFLININELDRVMEMFE